MLRSYATVARGAVVIAGTALLIGPALADDEPPRPFVMRAS